MSVVDFYRRGCFLLSAGIIYLLYGSAFTIRYLATVLLNLILFARLRHERTNLPLIKPLEASDISLQRRDRHFGLHVKRILLDNMCPLAYKMMELDGGKTIVIQLCSLENIWLGARSGSVAIGAERAELQYYIINRGQWGTLQFLKPIQTIRPSRSAEDLIDAKDPFLANAAMQAVSSDNVAEPNQQIRQTVTHFLQTLSINVERVIFRQQHIGLEAVQTKGLVSLSLETVATKYYFTDKNYVFQLSNFIARLADQEKTTQKESQDEKNIVHMQFTNPLFFRLDDVAQVARITFDDARGHVAAHLASNAVPEITKWINTYLSNDLPTPPPKEQEKARKRGKTKHPFRLEICLSVKITINTINRNVVRCCLCDLHFCYDSVIDNNRFFTRLKTGSLYVETNNDAAIDCLMFAFGLLECDVLLQQSVSAVLCESAKLRYTKRSLKKLPVSVKNCDSADGNNVDGTMLTIAEGTSLSWNKVESDHLILQFEDNESTHLFGACDAHSLNCALTMVDAVARDLLDTFLPNRLFVPGLAAARQELHARTDRPLAAVEQKRRVDSDSFYQPPLLFVFSLRGIKCNVEIKLGQHLTASYCTLAFSIAAFDSSMFALPTALAEFCESTLASSWALDLTYLVLRDSVVGSHWRHACDAKLPVSIRFIQKCRYLPFQKSEKKLRVYSNSAQVLQLDAHIHEAFLRFLVAYYKTAVATDDQSNKPPIAVAATVGGAKTRKPLADDSAWWLRMAQLDFTISYKPQTAHGTLVYSTFFDSKTVPNLSLSNAHISLQPYDTANALPSFGACMQHYFSQCCPQIESILLSASKALPVVQPVVQTASDLASDLTNPRRSWKQTAARVASNVIYSGTKLSVATFKIARSTDRWLAKKQSQQRREAQQQPTSYSCPTRLDDRAPLLCAQDNDDDDNDDDNVDSCCAHTQPHDEPPDNSRLLSLDELLQQDYLPQDTREKEDQQDIFGNDLRQCFDKGEKNCNATKKETVSIYANQPHSVTRGLSDGGSLLQENVQVAFDALVVEPQRAYKENGGSWRHGAAAALYGLPRLLLCSASGISGATVKIGHGISNAIDKEKCQQRKNKWKSASYVD